MKTMKRTFSLGVKPTWPSMVTRTDQQWAWLMIQSITIAAMGLGLTPPTDFAGHMNYTLLLIVAYSFPTGQKISLALIYKRYHWLYLLADVLSVAAITFALSR